MIALLLNELFPESVSDETAYHLVCFFEQLATELDSHYFAQTKRYLDSQRPTSAMVHPKNNDNEEMPF